VVAKQWWEPWYRRETGGRWRYCIDSAYVPGARDLRAKDLWVPRRIGTKFVEFPLEIVRTPAFKWARHWWASTEELPKTLSGGAVVTSEEWEARRDELVGLSAPELNAWVMLTVGGLAALLNQPEKTTTSYIARGYLPKATVHHDRHPLWSVPIVLRTLAVMQKQRRITKPPVSSRNPDDGSSPDLNAMLRTFNLDDPDDYELNEQNQDDNIETWSDRYS
jgi:hypothetical protein